MVEQSLEDTKMAQYQQSHLRDTMPDTATDTIRSITKTSVNFGFTLQILTQNKLAIKGEVQMSQQTKTQVPQRASAPVDIEQVYDDSVTSMPRSAVRYRAAQPQQSRATDTLIAQTPRTSNRVSGTTRLLLWLLLALCVAFLVNGLVVPAITDAFTQLRYGDARIATFDIDKHHFITEESNGRVRIVVSNADGSHSQQLTTVVSNAPKHALVTLKENGTRIDVSINDAYVTYLVADSNGYKWGSN